ncbi:MAG TPA: YkgJ family cysteine cluster protein [Thermoanaerobaculia bacterium]|nr:YkgJ family cysteine cluster protein [Thermoanaerobaculia bacterium]
MKALDARDDALIAEVDARMREAAEHAGDRWRCGPGRIDCCIGPFPIDALDARRLARGVAELQRDAPERAAAQRERIREAVELMRDEFPGDPESGTLDDDAEELLEACEWHAELPCPVLDPATGLCELYRFRPMVCRTFGPPLRVHGKTWIACPHCFVGEGPQVVLDEEGRADALAAEVEVATGRAGHTFIAFAVDAALREAESPKRSESDDEAR